LRQGLVSRAIAVASVEGLAGVKLVVHGGHRGGCQGNFGENILNPMIVLPLDLVGGVSSECQLSRQVMDD
jgi:hypothetical protein